MAYDKGVYLKGMLLPVFLRVKYDWTCHLFTYFIYFSRINMLMGVPQ